MNMQSFKYLRQKVGKRISIEDSEEIAEESIYKMLGKELRWTCLVLDILEGNSFSGKP